MEQIWWERVPNARKYISDVVKCILDEKSLVLNSSVAFPWYSHMVNTITSSVRQQNSSNIFEMLSDIADPGVYLLHKCCKAEKRAGYRPTKSYAKFFAESDDIVMHMRYFWVKINTKEQLDAWVDFASEYIMERGKHKNSAVFILEWINEQSVPVKKGLKVYSFDDYVSQYDRIVFCTIAASALRESTLIKNYLTELSSNVAGNDIELCAWCLSLYNDFLIAPYATVVNIIKSKVRSDYSNFVFNKSQEDIYHENWLAQIKTIYPVLEEYREDFVHRYSSEISRHLPITSSYGVLFSNPEEVELGTLKFMVDNRMFYIKQDEYDRLKINKEARNKLSHLIPLPLEEVLKLNRRD